MEFYLGIIFCGALTFAWRILLSRYRQNDLDVTSDTTVHFYFIKALSGNLWQYCVKNEKRFLIAGDYIYPQLFHKIMAVILGNQRCFAARKYVNPVFDAMFNMYLFAFTFMVIEQTPLAGKSVIISFAVSVLYIFSPLLFFFEARMANFGERVFSYALAMMSIMLTVLYLEKVSISYFLLIVFLNTIIILSSQFSFQAILFFQLGISLLTQNLIPFITLLVAFTLSFCLRPRGMVAYLKGKIDHFRWYYQSLANKTRSLDYIYKDYWRKMLVYGLVYFLLPVIAIFGDPLHLVNQPMFYTMFRYIIISWVFFFLTYSPLMKPMGEAHRYLEYSYPFALIIFVYACFLSRLWLLMGILLAVNLLSTLHHVLTINFTVNDPDELDSLIQFAQKHQDKRILPIPLKLSFFLAIHLDNPIVSSAQPSHIDKRVVKSYGIFISDFEKINSIYPFDWIVLRKSEVPSSDFSGRRVIFQNSSYIIYEM